ncbi:inositol monophosphatase family protein [Psittacicella hinzii]|uniref:Inositol monophosphatase family protein n=1 Tax=Psittacicella hinzii TaxID=2028575 RepID=A0A3A1YP81_9GAMM|nr:inositol monophosphatase family protein [Psittacicella hinzii]RIY39306.1 hypothetical protein CKF58_02375 [Psittacicella hinzii]
MNTSKLAAIYSPAELEKVLPELFKNQVFLPVCQLLINAGAVATAVGAADLAVDLKDDNSEVTYVDKMLSTYFTEQLPQIFGDFAISEENMAEYPDFDLQHTRCWWLVDPLDGTKGYAQGRADYCHMLSFIDQGQALMTFVYEPVAGKLHYAVQNLGVFVVSLESAAITYQVQGQEVSEAQFVSAVRQAGSQAMSLVQANYQASFKFKRIMHADAVNTYEFLVCSGVGNVREFATSDTYMQYLTQQVAAYQELKTQALQHYAAYNLAWNQFITDEIYALEKRQGLKHTPLYQISFEKEEADANAVGNEVSSTNPAATSAANSTSAAANSNNEYVFAPKAKAQATNVEQTSDLEAKTDEAKVKELKELLADSRPLEQRIADLKIAKPRLTLNPAYASLYQKFNRQALTAGLQFWRKILTTDKQVASKAELTFLNNSYALNAFRKAFAAWVSKFEQSPASTFIAQEEVVNCVAPPSVLGKYLLQQCVLELRWEDLADIYKMPLDQDTQLSISCQNQTELTSQSSQVATNKTALAVNADFAELGLDIPAWAWEYEHYTRYHHFYLAAYSIKHFPAAAYERQVRLLASAFNPLFGQSLNLGGEQEVPVRLNLQHFPHLDVLASHNKLAVKYQDELLLTYVTLGHKAVNESLAKKMQYLTTEEKFYLTVLVHLTAELADFAAKYPNPHFILDKTAKPEAYAAINLIQGARTQQALGVFALPYREGNFKLDTMHSAGVKASKVFACLSDGRLTNYLLPNAMKIWDVAPALVYAQNSTSPHAMIFNLSDVNQVPWKRTNINFSSEEVYPLMMTEDYMSIPFILDIPTLMYLQLPYLLNFHKPLKEQALARQHYCQAHPENAQAFMAELATREMSEEEFIATGLNPIMRQAWQTFKTTLA